MSKDPPEAEPTQYADANRDLTPDELNSLVLSLSLAALPIALLIGLLI